MKCAKVIVFYFGDRRRGSNNLPIRQLIPEIIDNVTKVDVGFATDTFFVVNKSNTKDDLMLNKYHGMPTINGKIRVVSRDNIGLSFGGYLDIFNQYKNEYDYWFFTEDDVIVYHPNYIKEFIDELIVSDSTFIALAPVSDYIKPHCGGGCGLTSTNYMNEVYSSDIIKNTLSDWSTYSGYDSAANSLGGYNSEIQFSSKFKLSNHTEFSPICSNYLTHEMQLHNSHRYNLKELKFIYKVGK